MSDIKFIAIIAVLVILIYLIYRLTTSIEREMTIMKRDITDNVKCAYQLISRDISDKMKSGIDNCINGIKIQNAEYLVQVRRMNDIGNEKIMSCYSDSETAPNQNIMSLSEKQPRNRFNIVYSQKSDYDVEKMRMVANRTVEEETTSTSSTSKSEQQEQQEQQQEQPEPEQEQEPEQPKQEEEQEPEELEKLNREC